MNTLTLPRNESPQEEILVNMPAIKPKAQIVKAEPKAEPRRMEWWDPTLCGAVDYGPFTRMFLNHGNNTGQGVYSGFCKGVLADASKTGDFIKSEAFVGFLRALTRKSRVQPPFPVGRSLGEGRPILGSAGLKAR